MKRNEEEKRENVDIFVREETAKIIMEATKKNNVTCIEDCNLCSSEEVSKKCSIYDLVLKLLNNECARVWWKKNAVELNWKEKNI